jgi:hypothetical protein
MLSLFKRLTSLVPPQVHEDGEVDEKEQDLLEAETWSGAGRRRRRAHREQRASTQRRPEAKQGVRANRRARTEFCGLH